MKKILIFIFLIFIISFSSSFSQVKISELTLTATPNDSAMYVIVWDSSGTNVSRRTLQIDLEEDFRNRLIRDVDTLYVIDTSGADTSLYFDDGDTTRITSDNPIKIGTGSLVVSGDTTLITLMQIGGTDRTSFFGHLNASNVVLSHGLGDTCITTAKIKADAIDSTKISNRSIETNDIDNKAITMDELALAIRDTTIVIQFTIFSSDTLDGDYCPLWTNWLPYTVFIDSIHLSSLKDNCFVSIRKRDKEGGSPTTVDDITIDSNGTGLYYKLETTITNDSLNTDITWEITESDSSTRIKGHIYGHWEP